MSSNINIREFLHEVLANKFKTKLTIEQFGQLLEMTDQIQKFSQKGLLIIALTQQLHKLSNVNYVAIKKFMNQFLTGLKPEKPRKQRQGGQQRRRRNRPADRANAGGNLEQMAQQSLSNPSNLQRARIGVQGAPSQQSQSIKVSQNMSKKSDPNKKDFEFANQLNQISQGLQFITGQQYQQDHEEQIQQYSKASSSSQSFGVVSNFSQKMDLLRKASQQGQKKTKVIKRTLVEATATKKKAKTNVIDIMLTLQKTKATLNESGLMEQRSLSYQYCEWFDHYHNQQEYLKTTEQQFMKAINQASLSSFENVNISARKRDQRQNHFENIDTDFTQFDTGFQGETMQDFASQPIPEESFEFSNAQINQLSIFRYDDSNPTLGEISAKVNKPEAVVFYQMLARMQKGEVTLTQENPQSFGQIRVELIAHTQ